MAFQGLHHHVDVFGHINRAQPGKDVQVGLTELDTVVGEAALPSIVPVAPKNTVVVRNAYGPFDRR
tara:strand:+ start:66 stop:263 length:198 start_codon:yes stop_codon:yes gene_type:complete